MLRGYRAFGLWAALAGVLRAALAVVLRAALAVVLLAALTGLMLAAQIAGAAPTNHRQATSKAEQILASLRLPSGSSQSQTDPSGGSLAQPALGSSAQNSVDLTSFWRVPGDPRSVDQWLQQNPPSGAVLSGRGEGMLRHGTQEWDLEFSFGSPGRELAIGLVGAGGGTALRADAEVMWFVLRPRWEKVPRDVSSLQVRSVANDPPRRRSLIVTSRSAIRRIVSMVNRLPAAQPVNQHCPKDSGPDVTLAFLQANGHKPVAVVSADGSGCGGVRFTLRGRRGPALNGGRLLVSELESLLKTRF